MGIPSHGDIDGEGNLAVPGQALPPCQEHRGTCLRCKTEITVRPRKKFQGEERRQRKTISIKVPKDAQEDGGEIWDNLLEQCETKLRELGVIGEKIDPPPPEGYDRIPPYYTLTKVMYDWLTA